MKQVFHGGILALQFLTRIPLRIECGTDEKTLKWALRFFPVSGLVIGACMFVLFQLLNDILPASMLSLLLISVWVYLSGGLHLDGVMDVADAAGSNGDVEKKREILKDSRAGSFAVLAVIFLLGWKMAFVHNLLAIDHSGIYLIVIPMLSRFQVLMHLYGFKAFQTGGLASFWKQHLSMKELIIAACWLLPFMAFNWIVCMMFLLQLLFCFLFGRWSEKQFQGINGDTAGASIEGAEIWNLGVLFSFFLFGMV
ncbi:adenosylcobinamide-GDP ribazoletransferase [Metabacillus indicus]|uniref:adenosylcobinamide-GDP ribazoletransferase n=1 Tax=Metabacillus indicus TaxID=246786 RepID=UPI00316EC7D3